MIVCAPWRVYFSNNEVGSTWSSSLSNLFLGRAWGSYKQLRHLCFHGWRFSRAGMLLWYNIHMMPTFMSQWCTVWQFWQFVFSLCVIRSKNGKGKVGPAFLYTSHISCLQMYRGRLKNGTFIAIRCLKMKKSHSTRNFMHHIELISKLRHCHLVSALGHCFECYFDDSSVSRIFLIFEYVPNGTLRSWISGNSWKSLIHFSGWRI